MNSPKLKTVLLGLSCFAFASSFAQDSPSTPKPDTTKWPKHDSTSMKKTTMQSNLANYNVAMLSASFIANNGLAAVKKEAENEILTKKSFAKISS